MTKQKILILIPLAMIGLLNIYCWFIILTTNSIATWQHYIGLIFFLVLLFLFFKNERIALLAIGVYLLFAIFNLLAMTSEITTSWFRIASFETPHFQLLSLGLFTLYFILNNGALIDMYLDRKEKKHSKTQKNVK
ncbi:MAG: hypothetical protein JWN83_2389 [Chitinophagaceae bacterium]|nr:hypothetical protein [Chitinophagaceae bacterium]